MAETPQNALVGLRRLAFDRCNDAVRLLRRMDTLTDREIARLNLSVVSEIRRHKDGTLEIKFCDRLKALELLASYTAAREGPNAASSFYAALESAARAVRDADEV